MKEIKTGKGDGMCNLVEELSVFIQGDQGGDIWVEPRRKLTLNVSVRSALPAEEEEEQRRESPETGAARVEWVE